MPVNERVQEAPVGTLRAAFAGIGRFLKITDKVRNKPAAGETPAEVQATAAPETVTAGTPAAEVPGTPAAGVPEAPAAEVVAPEAPAVTETAAPAENAADLESATAEPVAAESAVAESAAETAAEEPAASAPEAGAPEAAEAGTSAAKLPLANYDSLTVASVRARLRNLSVAQLNELLEYEKSHAGRADFIAAFERRIAKVESES